MFVQVNEDISLKLIELKDADIVFSLTDESRDYLRQWLPWLDFTTTVEDTKAWIKGALQGYVDNKSMTTAILFKGSIVGIASYNEIDWSNKVAYLGYWLAQKHQGHGIMTNVARALTDYALTELQLNKVDIRAAIDNKKSRSIPERLGFEYEGKLRQAEWLYDHYVDHAVYSMLAQDWK